MTVDEFKEHVLAQDPEGFCADSLFQFDNWLFEASGLDEVNATYKDFRIAVGSAIDISPDDIRLVGSSKYGVSMNPMPEKRFREFNDDSDLDVLIVAPELYSEIWREFLTAYYGGYTWIKRRHSGDVFRRFLHLLPEEKYDTAYLREAARRMDGMAKQVLLRTGLSRPLKYRIYASWDDATGYHAYGIRKLQRILEDDAQ